jgi:hypothetical protein
MVRVAIFLLALWLAPAHAAVPYAFETTPGQLPKTVVPRHYAIELTPDLQTLRAAGLVTIDIGHS